MSADLFPRPPQTFRCYWVEKSEDGSTHGRVTERRLDELPPGEVLIRVAYSSVNYKDALSASGHPGVTKAFPHIPGVDAAGVVVDSGAFEFVPGDRVIVTGFDQGASRWGGFAEYVRVPQDWIVHLPAGLTLRESMILGTAGLTAGMCVDALTRHNVTPDRGDLAVTGASGGVGSTAVAILARLGYRVLAVTGKLRAHGWLRELGAADILPREALCHAEDRPMLSARFAGGIDCVGGNTLTTLLRSVRHSGCVAACGLAGSSELRMTVYPFILRGITLAGVDAAFPPDPLRHETWQKLAGDWKAAPLDRLLSREIELDQLPDTFDALLAGRSTGRTLVRLAGEAISSDS